MSKHICFVISPIGEAGTDIRRDADYFLELIVKATLEKYGFEIIRGDHNTASSKIDADVIRMVQTADLCIAEITKPNPNVYYEVGRRDETGKHMILFKKKGSDELPVDIKARRYIEYDFDANSILIATQQLKEFVSRIIDSLSDNEFANASLTEIADTLERVERKLDWLDGLQPKTAAVPQFASPTRDPLFIWETAVRENDIALMEHCMEQLGAQMKKADFLATIAIVTANKGSEKAGRLLVYYAEEFFYKKSIVFKKKVDYLGALVSYCYRANLMGEYGELIERIAKRLLAMYGNQAPNQVALVYNQMNRIYYGLYAETKNEAYLDKAIDQLQKVLRLTPNESWLYYNLAVCYQMRNETMDQSLMCITKAIAIGDEKGKTNTQQIKKACELAKAMNDSRYSGWLERLRAADSYSAKLVDL